MRLNCHFTRSQSLLPPLVFYYNLSGGLDLADVPQFVMLTFDDAVTALNSDFYLGFKDMKNPNQCRITMTFFLSHLYTDYTMVNELHRLGHEIALHSVT